MGRADASSRRGWRRRSVRGAMVWLLVVTVMNDRIGAGERPQPDESAAGGVRAYSEAIRVAIAMGVDRSATFRRLHDTIDASDGIVYVVEGQCRRSVHACLLMRVTVAGPYRVLRIRVDPQKASGCELVGLIGHELQHAGEVLADPTVRSDAALYWLFDRIGKAGSERFETVDALAVGYAVEREVCRAD